MSCQQRRTVQHRVAPWVVTVALGLVFILLQVAGGAEAASWLHGPKSQVVHLTKDNFRALVVESDLAAVVEFYNSQDPTSINTGPIFDVLALDYGGLMTVGVVNMDEEKELTTFFSHPEHNVPFVVLFPPEREEVQPGVEPREKGPFAGKEFTYYMGPIDPKELADFALSPLHDRYVVRVTEDNRASFHDEAGMPKAFWFSDNNSKPPVLVQALSQAFQGRMKVGYVRRNHAGVFAHYGIPLDQVRLLVISKDWQMHHYGGRPTAHRIFRFIDKHALPRATDSPTPATSPAKSGKDEL